ncbi:MAG: beta-ketoacyl-[acyl-carrier-protein] synthase family protein [Cyclobacteriaceae bacterium]
MERKRVVITGMGVVAPNGVGIDDFSHAIHEGRSGIRFQQESADLNFRCQIAGIPPITDEYTKKYLPNIYQRIIKNNAILYGCLAGLEAWEMAGFIPSKERLPRCGMIFGGGALGLDGFIQEPIEKIDAGSSRLIGTTIIPQSMNSGAASYLNQLLGFGGPVISNSSACSTGSEAIMMGYEQIQLGKADIMLCGSTEGVGRYIWGAFDTMRILASNSNENPEEASKPMSQLASGFVPSGGAGAIVLETLESAQKRDATIVAELVGVAQNCGAQRDGGSMTAPNPKAAIECIKEAIASSGIVPDEIDLISGHLTSTRADPLEISNWVTALGLPQEKMPPINTLKSMVGHCISAAGSIESVACLLQIRDNFIHKNINIDPETIHHKIKEIFPIEKIPTETINRKIKTVIKSNFGFGDVNCSLIFKQFSE